MAKRSEAWKDLEREVAEALGGVRVSRGADFSESDVDVVIADLPHLKVDAKYRKGHAHHSLILEVEQKYCSNTSHVPVLATKHHRQRGFHVTVPGWYFARLLDSQRKLNAMADRIIEKLEEVQK